MSVHFTEDPVPIPCSQFVRRAAALLPTLVMLVMALAAPATAQKNKTPSGTVSYSDASLLNMGVNTTFGVSVTPDNQSQVVSPGASLTFRVTNTGTVTTSYTATVNCTPQCSISAQSQSLSNVSPGASSGRNVIVSLGTYFGTVTLTAAGSGVSDTGSIIPSAATYTVGVGPDGSPDYWFEAGQAGTANFTVSNSGNSAATYSLSGSCDAVATGCSAAPGSVTVGSGGSVPVPITFTAGAAGSSGYARLNASGPSSDGGTVHILVYSHTVTVAAPAAVAVDPGSYTASFYVTNTGNVATSYNLTSTCGGQITGCTASLGQITVAAGGTSPAVSVPYTAVNREDVGTVTLTASYAGNGAVNASAAMGVTVKDNYGVAVTPDNQGQIVSPSGSVTFRVANVGSIQTSFNLSVNCACGISPSTTITVPKGGVTTGVDVIVSLNGTTGTVILTASDAAHGTSDTGSIIVTAPTYTVSASPDTNPQTVAQPIDANKPGSQTFNIYNMGNSLATYAISVTCPPNFFSNCNSATSLQVPSGATLPLTVSFTAAPPGGVGTMTLTASAQNTSDVATARWQVNTHYVSVAKGGTATVYAGSGLTQLVGVTNNGNVSNSYTLTASCSGSGVSTCSAPASVSNIPAGNTQQVTVTYTGADAGGTGTIQLVARNTIDAGIADSGTVSVIVKPKYTVAATPDSGKAQVDPWSTASVPFLITNNGTAQGVYSLTPFCTTGMAVRGDCTVDSSIITIPKGQGRQVMVTFPAGASKDTATILLYATSLDDGTFTDYGTVGVTVTTYAVSVTPDSLPVALSAYATDTRTFTVTNTGTTQRTFRFQAACAPPAATGCSANRDTVTLVPSASVPVNVSYTAGDPGTTGTVRLVATDTLARSADDGTLRVTVSTSVANNQVQFKNINPGTTIERSACLVFSIVPDVADECGALRIVHPLPAVRTLGKTRVPTLLYSSDQVQGPALAVNVILADTTPIPQWVQLTVVRTWRDGHHDTITQQYPGIEWQTIRRRRITVPNIASGDIAILRYSVAVSLLYAGGTSKLAAPIDSSELAFVDRTNSAFGGGWWLAGLEQLFPGQYDGSILWVAGDGSTRKYVNKHAAVVVNGLTDSVYLAAALDRPDTLLLRPDTIYQRQAGNGLYVEFNGTGLHLRTVNRLGYATVFTYQGKNLSTIQLPPLQAGGGPAFTYTFAYNATSGLLDNIIAPPANGVRNVTLTRNGATPRVEKITELLPTATYTVAFDTVPGLLYGARYNRRGVRTSIAYEPGLPTVARFNTPTGTGTGPDTISVEHSFRTASSLGTSVSVALDSVYVRYDGPQPAAVGDTTLFWLDRFGAPTRIVNALNQETRITRGDPRFPGLVTETRGPYPKYFTTWASYDARGNILTSTQVNPHGDAIAIDATTTYRWDPKWDMPTQIIQPEGDFTNIGYDAATGNRVSQDDGRGAKSSVTFKYYATTDPATGAIAKLLSGVVVPKAGALDSASTKVQYDVLGNVDTTRTPGGAWTATTNDAIGRTIVTANKIYADSADTVVVKTTTDYDGKDRVLTSVTTGPPTNQALRQTVTVQNEYNAEGQLEHTVRMQAPDDPTVINGTSYSVGWLVSRWRYDNLGRKIAELAPAPDTLHSPVDSTFYDRAGNVTSVLLRRRDSVTHQNYRISMTYDALNRLKTRTVPAADYCPRSEGFPTDDPQRNPPYPQYPNNTCAAGNNIFFPNSGGYTVSADVASFGYDQMGNMTTADNADALVRRYYYPNGQVRYDSLIIGTVNRDTTVHRYGMEYIYDRDGRVQTLKHPSVLSGGATGYQTGMRYDPVTGALSTVINPISSTYTYTYDERGQVSGIAMPRGVTENYGYDQDGDVTHQLTAAGSVSTFHDVTMSYDLLGKMTHLANAVAGKDTIDTNYSGLGQLHNQTQFTHLKGNPITTRYVSMERFSNDAMGNRRGDTTQTSTSYQGGGFPGYTFIQRQSAYERGTGRLLVSQNPGVYRDTTEYDEAGNIVFTTQVRPDTFETLKADRASFYGADGKLRAVDYRTTLGGIGDYERDFEEYRYDALGRRVLVRARRSCSLNGACSWSYVRRTVWAGEQELYEIQMPDDSLLRENDTAALPHMALTYLRSDPNMFYGRVAYTYGLVTDRPLGITRLGYADSAGVWDPNKPFTIVPLWTMRGYADTSYFAETGATNCIGGRCVGVSYPAEYWMPAFRMGFIPFAFHGSLLMDKADASGQLFRRNRYYDPATGRFTQEDPIGLAGGLNVYGFAAGDPVNFSDPFGLCTIKDWTDCKLLSFTGGWGWGIGFSTSVGPVSVEGKAGKAGVEGSLSLGADGRTHTHHAATIAAFSGSVRALSHKFEAEGPSCSTDEGCKPGSVTIRGVEAASNGDISGKLQVGIELGLTIHAGETGTALIGAAKFAWDIFRAEALKTIPTSIAP